jgi:hypothetical protein
VNNNNDDDDEEEDEEQGDWVIRCVCGGSTNSGLMVCCDTCDVWQHAGCFGIREEKAMPEHWFCEKCKPRKFDCSCGMVSGCWFSFVAVIVC